MVFATGLVTSLSPGFLASGDLPGDAVGDATGAAVGEGDAVAAGVGEAAGLFGGSGFGGSHALRTAMLAAKIVDIKIDLLIVVTPCPSSGR